MRAKVFTERDRRLLVRWLRARRFKNSQHPQQLPTQNTLMRE